MISQLTPDSKPCVKVPPHTAPLSLKFLIMAMLMKSLKITILICASGNLWHYVINFEKEFIKGKVGTWAYIVHYKQPFASYPILLPKIIRLATCSLFNKVKS